MSDNYRTRYSRGASFNSMAEALKRAKLVTKEEARRGRINAASVAEDRPALDQDTIDTINNELAKAFGLED